MALDLGIWDRIRELRARFADAHPDAIHQINQWESDLKRISDLDDFSQHPIAAGIVSNLKSRLKEVLIDRATRQGHTPESLKILDARETELRYVLSLLRPNYQKELQSLIDLIDAELS